VGLCAARGLRRFGEGGRCMDYSLPISVKRVCGGGECKGGWEGEVPGC